MNAAKRGRPPIANIPIETLERRAWLTISEAMRLLGVRDPRTARRILEVNRVGWRTFRNCAYALYDCEDVKKVIVTMRESLSRQTGGRA